jgi:hypothetical protein
MPAAVISTGRLFLGKVLRLGYGAMVARLRALAYSVVRVLLNPLQPYDGDSDITIPVSDVSCLTLPNDMGTFRKSSVDGSCHEIPAQALVYQKLQHTLTLQ